MFPAEVSAVLSTRWHGVECTWVYDKGLTHGGRRLIFHSGLQTLTSSSVTVILPDIHSNVGVAYSVAFRDTFWKNRLLMCLTQANRCCHILAS